MSGSALNTPTATLNAHRFHFFTFFLYDLSTCHAQKRSNLWCTYYGNPGSKKKDSAISDIKKKKIRLSPLLLI